VERKSNCTKCGLFPRYQKRSICFACEKERKDEWRANNLGKHRARSKAWVEANPDKRAATVHSFLERNPDSGKEARRVWRQVNKDKVNLSTSMRRRRLREAKPALNEFDELFLAEIYDLAQRTNLEVDHIVPLTNKRVCGLHCPNNLQLLTKTANSSKGNKYDQKDAIRLQGYV
jgi:5-methylcytosine-specific restriction endonuclease McrA